MFFKFYRMTYAIDSDQLYLSKTLRWGSRRWWHLKVNTQQKREEEKNIEISFFLELIGQ